jgi:hypothetical protein
VTSYESALAIFRRVTEAEPSRENWLSVAECEEELTETLGVLDDPAAESHARAARQAYERAEAK